MGNRYWPSDEKKTIATCPRCGLKFTVCIFYTGTIPLKKFCHTCEHMAKVYPEVDRYGGILTQKYRGGF